ncbi:hypothetical protein M422DRAFT_201119 [Sphaerobolus stellatus SS14]|nr:hypothetical protein M422DRAFT_201119 [Sphaerobolus stellatus SS14]
MDAVKSESVGIIGSGAAGIISAYTLLQDGFQNVQILTRDKSPGGIWARERIYPGLIINNVHGEFRFSPLPMPPPSDAAKTGGRLSGEDMCNYMESFSDRFLKGRFRLQTEVLNIRRDDASGMWVVKVKNLQDNAEETLRYSKIILCTGGCSEPYIHPSLSPGAALKAKFTGPVFHSSQFGSHTDSIMQQIKEAENLQDENADSVVIVGGGKSAQDISAYLASKGRKVTVVFEVTDAVLAATSPLPDFIRKSRFLSILSPHSDLNTRLERFFHTTWLGSKMAHGIWNAIGSSSFDALKIPKNSPLRNAHSIFWGIRTNDEGAGRPTGFHTMVSAGKIALEAPARVERFGDDGRSVVLNNGKVLKADAVILATGYTSSWKNIFDEKTMADIGIERHPPSPIRNTEKNWEYTSLRNPPKAHPDAKQWASSIYRGIIPAKNIQRRDFAINGAVFTTNNGYFFEVTSHWISAYFLGDKMRLPSTPEEALEHTERNAAWLRKRFPDMLLWANESYSSSLSSWTWPQAADQLLEDMYLVNMRSGGNWITWPFKVIDLSEIAHLKEERNAKRH